MGAAYESRSPHRISPGALSLPRSGPHSSPTLIAER